MWPIPLRSLPYATLSFKMKVTLLFVLCLVVPSVFLLLLAIRGIENDQALAEQTLLSEHRALANTIVAAVESEIVLIEEVLARLIQDLPGHDDSGRDETVAPATASGLIDEVFALKQDDWEFPFARLLYGTQANEPRAGPPSRSPGLARLIGAAEENEFQLKNYARAGELYRTALNRTDDDDARTDLLMRVARVEVRQGALMGAQKTYAVVAKRHAQNRLPGGLPGGVAARLELVRLSLRTDIAAQAGRLLQELYEELLACTWTLNRPQFRFVQSEMGALATALKDSFVTAQTGVLGIIDELRRTADSLASRTDHLLQIRAAVRPVILKATRAEAVNGISRRRLVIAGDDGQRLLLIAESATREGHRVQVVGAVLNQAELTGRVLPKIIAGLSLSENSTLRIAHPNGTGILGAAPGPDSRRTVAVPFSGNFPPWAIEFYQNDPQFFDQLLSSRRSFYVYALILVMLALIFGAIMTTRMMTREMELARLKSDFVSTVSHEFRSPLTSIRQLSEMLHSGRVVSEVRRRQYYNVILEQSERLSLLVGNILDLAKIDERRLTLDRIDVDMADLLRGVVFRVRKHGGGDDIPIALQIKDPLPRVFVDPGAITHIMDNLIDNAIKYSGSSPHVSVTARTDDGELLITVEDRGIGIPEEETRKIFERFYRGGDEFTRRVKGTGLGLSLVRDLVHAHNGTVQVASEPGVGSTFTVRLPLETGQENKRG